MKEMDAFKYLSGPVILAMVMFVGYFDFVYPKLDPKEMVVFMLCIVLWIILSSFWTRKVQLLSKGEHVRQLMEAKKLCRKLQVYTKPPSKILLILPPVLAFFLSVGLVSKAFAWYTANPQGTWVMAIAIFFVWAVLTLVWTLILKELLPKTLSYEKALQIVPKTVDWIESLANKKIAQAYRVERQEAVKAAGKKAYEEAVCKGNPEKTSQVAARKAAQRAGRNFDDIFSRRHDDTLPRGETPEERALATLGYWIRKYGLPFLVLAENCGGTPPYPGEEYLTRLKRLQRTGIEGTEHATVSLLSASNSQPRSALQQLTQTIYNEEAIESVGQSNQPINVTGWFSGRSAPKNDGHTETAIDTVANTEQRIVIDATARQDFKSLPAWQKALIVLITIMCVLAIANALINFPIKISPVVIIGALIVIAAGAVVLGLRKLKKVLSGWNARTTKAMCICGLIVGVFFYSAFVSKANWSFKLPTPAPTPIPIQLTQEELIGEVSDLREAFIAEINAESLAKEPISALRVLAQRVARLKSATVLQNGSIPNFPEEHLFVSQERDNVKEWLDRGLEEEQNYSMRLLSSEGSNQITYEEKVRLTNLSIQVLYCYEELVDLEKIFAEIFEELGTNNFVVDDNMTTIISGWWKSAHKAEVDYNSAVDALTPHLNEQFDLEALRLDGYVESVKRKIPTGEIIREITPTPQLPAER